MEHIGCDSFIVTFSNNAPNPEKDSAAVQDFFAKMEGAFRVHSLWAGCSQEELESAVEGLEKYVMTKLYYRAFAPLPDDIKHDQQLFEKVALVQQFIRPENLDIKPAFQNETSWLLAQKELQKINMFKAPRDKLVCVLKCCKVINNLLLNASISSSETPPGADEFLPILIFVTIKANPQQLHSNLLYIQRYRYHSRLVSEVEYYFTNMLSAESFIWDLNGKSLSIDDGEFEKNMESAQVVLSTISSNSSNMSHQSNQDMMLLGLDAMRVKEALPLPVRGPPKTEPSKDSGSKTGLGSSRLSISDLENKGAAELLKEGVGNTFQEYPFIYARAGDLTIDDVEKLLGSYKQLVLKYVCLSRGMKLEKISSIEVSDPSLRDRATESPKEREDIPQQVAAFGERDSMKSLHVGQESLNVERTE